MIKAPIATTTTESVDKRSDIFGLRERKIFTFLKLIPDYALSILIDKCLFFLLSLNFYIYL